MRKFMRHPSDIPIEYKPEQAADYSRELLKNVCHGGLSFNSKTQIEVGTRIHLKIKIRKPDFTATGVVAWYEKKRDHFEIGVCFDEHTEFGVRMVEQVCQIEHYKKKVLKKEGRFLSGDEAATEWVQKNATKFPR
ncbi:MAG: PilZ domain-containing protein [Candidatus Cloacimonetes bacterium]|nr:PilZ domain-containing protein [Candidatus Cloacimonadota bacterium]